MWRREEMSAEPAAERLPVVAVVGRPNVGKSALVNRILGRREAIVEASPGVTRDRRSFVAEWSRRAFEVVDTGGLEPGQEGLEARVAEQAQVAIEAADAVVFVVDAAAGASEDDHAVAQMLRRANKPVLVVANKVDDDAGEPSAAEFYRLGLGDPVAVSALHGRGAGDLLAAVVSLLPERAGAAPAEWGSIAIVGRPNVGKSSLLNALLGESRALVDPTPGTTRDPVDSYLETRGGRLLRLVDTAGMRKRVRIADPIEYFSWLRSRGTIERADAALLVVDASEGVTAHDQRLAEAIVESGRACVIALNKWDLVGEQEGSDRARLEDRVRRALRFLSWAPATRTSAATNRGIQRVIPALEDAISSHRRRLPTAVVNRVVRDAQEERPHPRVGPRAVRILYAVQAEVSPPTFVVFATGRLRDAYLRYLQRRLRAVDPFLGTPLRVRARIRSRA
jgi:GTP-binding protein